MTLIATDPYIENLATITGKSYNELFDIEIANATEWMNEQQGYAVKHNNPIIWDQTNLTVKSRRAKIKKLVDYGYTVVGVFFDCPADVAEQRRNDRAIRTGKSIPASVIGTMSTQLTRPSFEEGFEQIIVITPESGTVNEMGKWKDGHG